MPDVAASTTRAHAGHPEPRCRLHLRVGGAVQGVGLRPCVHRLATAFDLAGWVANDRDGLLVEIEGPGAVVRDFVARLAQRAPAAARIDAIDASEVPLTGGAGFSIRPSVTGPAGSARIVPDLALCADCRREIFDPASRRHRYAFTTCTACGPRYTVQLDSPYDRINTTLAPFTPCAGCAAEYADPGDRRFHHQTNACPACGPRLRLLDPGGGCTAEHDAALAGAVAAIRGGDTVAIQGIGGFHLCADAGQAGALERLRAAKARPHKPFALMLADLDAARALCHVSADEAAALASPAAPIVLLRRRAAGAAIAAAVAPASSWLGIMLAATPLHALLLADLGGPIVATSGNRADEPLCTDADSARAQLTGIAAAFLVHDRRIARRCDDSLLRVVAGRPLLLRRARGYVPDPLHTATELPAVIGTGGHLKNTVARAQGHRIDVSAHIGDLHTEAARELLVRTARAWLSDTDRVACDAHPDYASTRIAQTLAARPCAVQHHLAHAAAVLAEHALTRPVLAAVWDGAGSGPDGSVWGGEIFRIDGTRARRIAHLRPFPLPGGERAAREPRRVAYALLAGLDDPALLTDTRIASITSLTAAERRVLARMLERGSGTIPTSSVGRLFDAVASLAGLAQTTTFEGQAAMALEAAALDAAPAAPYPISLEPGAAPHPLTVIDWRPLIRAIVADIHARVPVRHVAARFHATLTTVIVRIARACALRDVILAGGCFQNARLLEHTVCALHADGRTAYWPRALPPNDGALAVGQAYAVARGYTLES
ncbi:MAG: carbamoyltransferase HypF [Gammaproteobacteria bacterium]|nr:carbamoyltransferase HypF [Gammaproteobacteria bacterium]